MWSGYSNDYQLLTKSTDLNRTSPGRCGLGGNNPKYLLEYANLGIPFGNLTVRYAQSPFLPGKASK